MEEINETLDRIAESLEAIANHLNGIDWALSHGGPGDCELGIYPEIAGINSKLEYLCELEDQR